MIFLGEDFPAGESYKLYKLQMLTHSVCETADIGIVLNYHNNKS